MKELKLSIRNLFSAVCIFILMQCTTYANASTNTEKTLIIGPETADCTGVMPMKCLQIKDRNGTWTNLYTNIEGFTYEPGYEYVLKVQEQKIKNPPADGSAVQYILIREISKTKK
ncbi:DUF4377 domain-containing protein [Chryseobacterium profundimaris]|uniref:DUF4377 domain-containing protein n=1 Tax=Chryseobacterium profundimaris TaxID=1387275 RepID=A0ABY1NJ31_9FLAO|nr:DUF4377 domain-containing protein [Chryseobacterium profundimaris]SMP11190.1 protein of unknown function [Chryseobacterium profundimaris]